MGGIYTFNMTWKKYQLTDKKRNQKILAYSRKGFSSYQIAGIFHLTGQRIQQIIKKQIEKTRKIIRKQQEKL